MTDSELIELVNREYHPRVTVKGGDYSYEGNVVSTFQKRSLALRCVVEDDNGRLFIHNAGNIEHVHGE